MSTSVRFVESSMDDPDRQMALRITNFVGEMPLKRVVAIYALAIGMSFRGLGYRLQTSVLWSICEACRRTWATDDGQAAAACETCLGAGTLKTDGSAIRHEQVAPDQQITCKACGGRGVTA